jgi:hypothetical protein
VSLSELFLFLDHQGMSVRFCGNGSSVRYTVERCRNKYEQLLQQSAGIAHISGVLCRYANNWQSC